MSSNLRDTFHPSCYFLYRIRRALLTHSPVQPYQNHTMEASKINLFYFFFQSKGYNHPCQLTWFRGNWELKGDKVYLSQALKQISCATLRLQYSSKICACRAAEHTLRVIFRFPRWRTTTGLQDPLATMHFIYVFPAVIVIFAAHISAGSAQVVDTLSLGRVHAASADD